MPKITKKVFAIKLLFWLLPWPLSRALPKSLRIYYFGVNGNIYDGWWNYYGDQIHITQDIIDTFDFSTFYDMRDQGYLTQQIVDFLNFDLFEDMIDTEKYVFLDFFFEFQRGKRNEFRSISSWDQHFDSNDFECHDYWF